MGTATSLLCLVGTLAALSFTPHQDSLDLFKVRLLEGREGYFTWNMTIAEYCFDNCPARKYLNITNGTLSTKKQMTKDYCENTSVIGTHDFQVILVPLLAVVCIYSLVDGCLLYKGYTSAPSNKLLFSHMDSEERQADRDVDNQHENTENHDMQLSDGDKCLAESL